MAAPSTTQHQVLALVPVRFAGRNRPISSSNAGVATPANYASISAIDARLNAISATSYSAARLASMTLNDKVYALRLNDDPGTI
jgi:hypothetical protein